MPIYDYISCDGENREASCLVCRKGFELFRSLQQGDLTKCPVCRNPVRKLVSRVNTKVATKEFSDSEAKAAGFHVFNKNADGGYDKV